MNPKTQSVSSVATTETLEAWYRAYPGNDALDDRNSALVAVRDLGPGLAPKDIDRLFEVFYTTKVHGMGIGLPVCRSIVEAHGGQMWAGANEPRGAVFQFTVPLEPDKTVPRVC